MMTDDLELGRFEPLGPIAPHNVLDRHPNGSLVALQGYAGPLDRAGVWDVASGRLVWAPTLTVALCWLHGGTEVLLLRERGAVSLHDPSPTASPVDGDDWYVLERQTWPSHARVSTCKVVLLEGWGSAVAASPRDDLAAVRWLEQDAAGFVLVAMHPDGDRQLADAGYGTGPDNLMQGPVFSPDGRFAVISCGRALWWAGDDLQEDPAAPARGGRYVIGHVATYDVDMNEARETLIEENVPAGWLPDDPEDVLGTELLGTPQFITATDFTVALPIGGQRLFTTA